MSQGSLINRIQNNMSRYDRSRSSPTVPAIAIGMVLMGAWWEGRANYRFLFAEATAQPSPFVPEIFMGRCYANPPVAQAMDCPSVVGQLLGAFMGKSERMISMDDFKPYLQEASFAAPYNTGIFVIGRNWTRIPRVYVGPGDTPGGAIADGILFCGSDPTLKGCASLTETINGIDNISAGIGAQAAFWFGTYQAFAAGLAGRVTVVVQSTDDPSIEALVLLAALPALNASTVTRVHIVRDALLSDEKENGGTTTAAGAGAATTASTSWCESNHTLLQGIRAAVHHITTVTCVDDPYLLDLWMCAEIESIGCTWFQEMSSRYPKQFHGRYYASNQSDEAEAKPSKRREHAGRRSQPNKHALPTQLLMMSILLALAFRVLYVYHLRRRIRYERVANALHQTSLSVVPE